MLYFYPLCLKKIVWKLLCETQNQVAGWAPNSVFLVMRCSCTGFLLTEAHNTPGIPLAVISFNKSKKEEENPVATTRCHPCVWGTAVSVGWNPLLVWARTLPFQKIS